MDLKQFLDHLGKNKCKLIKGQEEHLFNTVRKFGCSGPNIEEVIEKSCPEAFRSKLHDLIKVIPLQK